MGRTTVQLIVSSFGALALGLALTVIVKRLASHLGIVASPRKDRWHQKPTALMGGVAIYAAFLICFLGFGPHVPGAVAIVAAASLLFVTGLVDDLIQIKPYTKLIVQLVAATIVVYFGVRLHWTNYQALNDFLTIFWLVGITNAINLLDNMDGLAGGIALITCGFLAATFLLNGQLQAAALPMALGSAVLGFLVFNFNPASIFMGDCGSMFLGFLLGGTALLSDYGGSRNLGAILLTPVLVLMIPIFDTCVVTLTRKLSGRPISRGGRDHTSHRLVALGISEKRAVIMLYSLAGFSGGVALLVRLVNPAMVMLVVPVFALGVLFLGLYLAKVRVYENGEERHTGAILTALADFSYKRRIFEVLLDAVLVLLAYYGANLLRFDGNMPAEQMAVFVRTLPLVIGIEMLAFLFGGVYRGLWKYVGISDMIVIARSVLGGALASAAVVFVMYGFTGPSRAVFVLNGLLLIVFVGASRLSFRFLRAALAGPINAHPDAKRVFIYGAGDDGELLMRAILNNPSHQYVPLGFIDDDRRKTGKLIHGCRIFDSREAPELIRAHGISEVLVSSSSVHEGRLDHLRGLGVSLRTMSIRFE
ncbi:MAG: hypothetical protein DMF61_14550 [Blastocatellia bacterium AA13]|nr:MAG: hypothetical protein DMF61_14550 [Blastocatellia bacterium AA13]